MSKRFFKIKTMLLLVMVLVLAFINIYIESDVIEAQGLNMNPASVYGRTPFRGYATNYYTGNSGGYSGYPVFSSGNTAANDDRGMPVYNTDDFLARIDGYLWASNTNQDAISAAFLINIMLGVDGTTFATTGQSIAYARANENDWGARVRAVSSCTLWGIDSGPLSTYQIGIPNSHFATDNGGGAVQPNDNAFYGNYSVQTKPTIVFRDPADGCATVLGRIKMNCGNPMGDIALPPVSQSWKYNVDGFFTNSTGTANLGNSVNVNAGDTVNLRSLVKHTGPIAGSDYVNQLRPMDATEDAEVALYLTLLTTSGSSGTWYQWDNTPTSINGSRANEGAYEISGTTPDGTQICFQARVAPASGTNSGADLTSQSVENNLCINIANARYDLAPPVVNNMPLIVAPGDVITGIGYRVCNTDDETNYFSNGGSRSSAIDVNISVTGDAGSYSFTNQTITKDNCWSENSRGSTMTIPTTAGPGDQYCVTVKANKNFGYKDGTEITPPPGEVSQRFCTTVGVTPYFHVLNGDVWAGAIFDSEVGKPRQTCGSSPPAIIRSVTSGLSGAPLGSFVERAAFATGVVSGFGSDGAPNLMDLIFANDPSLGEYTNETKCIPNYFGILSANSYASSDESTNNSGNLNSFSSNEQSKVTPNGGTFTLTGNNSNVSGNRTIVIDGNLVISNDLSYTSNYGTSTSLTIPSLVLVAKGNIYIDASVTRVDAILISHGTIWTCSNGSTPITAVAENVCNELLTINGALIANRINFMRTHEGGGNIGGVHDANSLPAEVINFSPEFYLSKPVFKSNYLSEDAFETLLIRDLPPIY